MAKVIINGYPVDTEEKLRYCTECGGHYYNAPEMVSQLALSQAQRAAFDRLEWGVAFCPECNRVRIWLGKDQVF